MSRGALAAALAAAAFLAQAAPAGALPPIKHVFIVTLENEDASTTFGAGSHAPYLAHTLRARGAFVPQYFGTAHLSLSNYIGMLSGQGPNPYTQADAPAYIDFLPGTPGPDGQAIGQGSVYPASVKTIANQLDDKGGTWRGYMEDMGNSATEPKTCRHPAVGSPDTTQQARKGDQYAARHNPFVYFHSIIDDQAKCDANVVPLGRLTGDLESASTTPDYSFISPNLCHDGHDAPCVDGQPGGLVSADKFLKQWIPKILRSPAYKQGGLVMIIFDEAGTHDASACCGEKQGPNTINNGGPTPGAGGGRTGAIFLSDFIKPGTQTKQAYNHYSLLRSTEDMLGLGHLGFAAATGLRPFGPDIFTNPKGKPLKPPPRPSVSLSGVPAKCVTHRFTVTVKARGRGVRIVVALDGRQVRAARAKSLTLTISARHAKRGPHRIRATAIDRFGRRATKSRQFVRCATG
jgi:hypothetical protein